MSNYRGNRYLNQLAQRALERRQDRDSTTPSRTPRAAPATINTRAATALASGTGPQTGNFMSLFQSSPAWWVNGDLYVELQPLLLLMLEFSNRAGTGQLAYTLMVQFITNGQGHWAASAAITEADNLIESQDLYLLVVVAVVVAAWSRDQTEATVSSFSSWTCLNTYRVLEVLWSSRPPHLLET
jgi:hypothetical protein